MTGRVVCADIGSTFTKVAVVDLGDGALVGSATYPTTVGTDVLDGLDVAVRAAGGEPCPLYVCSSAGGGLRLAVVGYERLVTARAAQQVGLTAGRGWCTWRPGAWTAPGSPSCAPHGRTWSCSSGVPTAATRRCSCTTAGGWARRGCGYRSWWRATPTPVRRSTGTARARGRYRWTGTGNVLPHIGVLNPGPARAALREVFLRHVIGGKKPSRGTRLASLVRGATPDLVLADDLGTDLAVVDVGGATTTSTSGCAGARPAWSRPQSPSGSCPPTTRT